MVKPPRVLFNAKPDCLYTIIDSDESLSANRSYIHYIINDVR